MTSMPTGEVTFLFTDMEGSSRMWEDYPEAMPDAIARHDQLIQSAVDAHDGHTFKTVGDAFCIAFHTPSDAVEAALDAQLCLLAEDWQGVANGLTQVKVRMGLHSGSAALLDGDYLGRTLNRTSRVMSSGHGGQILLSEATSALSDDALPAGCWLRDMGVHKLRDLAEPEHIHELAHPDLPARFPALVTLDSLPNNLPYDLSSFVGREDECERVRRWLSRSRLVTLTGPGGCGKTRVALQAAADSLSDFEDGVWLVELAPVEDATLVVSATATALGLQDVAGRATIDRVLDHLERRHALIVFDNCEHHVDECANIAHRILRFCPGVRVLVTSRQSLSVQGEYVRSVSALSAPPRDASIDSAAISKYESVQLFSERSRAHLSDFEVNASNAGAVARICQRLEGMPLAVELAAARTRVLSPDQIEHLLEESLLRLKGGWRTAPRRHRSLRATIDWSYGLLGPQERTMFNRLSVFAGGFTIGTVERICGAGCDEQGTDLDVLEVMEGLVDKSLAETLTTGGPQYRYRLQAALRDYAREKLEDSGELADVESRHADVFDQLAATAADELTGAEQKSWLDRLTVEHDNLRVALRWFIAERRAAQALHLSSSLWRFWATRGHLNEGQRWLSQALALTSDEKDLATRARAHNSAGCIAYYRGDYDSAQLHFQENLALSRRTQDMQGVVDALNNVATVACERGEFDFALHSYEECLPLQQDLGDQERIACILYNLGNLRHARGEVDAAEQLHRRSLEHAEKAGDSRAMADAIVGLADICVSRSDYTDAANLHAQGLSTYRELDDLLGAANALLGLGTTRAFVEDFDLAHELLDEAVEIGREIDDMEIIAEGLDVLGEVRRRTGDPAKSRELAAESLRLRREAGATRRLVWSLERHQKLALARCRPDAVQRLNGAVAAFRAEFGMSPVAVRVDDRLELDACLAAARSELGETKADEEWALGARMTLDEALDYALASV